MNVKDYNAVRTFFKSPSCCPSSAMVDTHSAHEMNSKNENEDSESCSQTSHTHKRDQAPVDQAAHKDVGTSAMMLSSTLYWCLKCCSCASRLSICLGAEHSHHFASAPGTLPDVWSSSERGIQQNLFVVLADDPIMLPHCRRCALQNLCEHRALLLDLLCPRLHLSDWLLLENRIRCRRLWAPTPDRRLRRTCFPTLQRQQQCLAHDRSGTTKLDSSSPHKMQKLSVTIS